MPKKILLVCTGNTCRSSMAEVMARKWLAARAPEEPLAVWSAGLAAWQGSPASPQAIQAMKERGIDLSGHRARKVDEKILADSELVLAVTDRHKSALRQNFPEYADKVFTLSEYAGQEPPMDIADPYGQAVEVYRQCALEMEALLEVALNKYLAASGRE